MNADEAHQQELEHQMWLRAKEANKELQEVLTEMRGKNGNKPNESTSKAA